MSFLALLPSHALSGLVSPKASERKKAIQCLDPLIGKPHSSWIQLANNASACARKEIEAYTLSSAKRQGAEMAVGFLERVVRLADADNRGRRLVLCARAVAVGAVAQAVELAESDDEASWCIVGYFRVIGHVVSSPIYVQRLSSSERVDIFEAVRRMASKHETVAAAAADALSKLVRTLLGLGEPVGSGCIARALEWALTFSSDAGDARPAVDVLVAMCADCFSANPEQARLVAPIEAVLATVTVVSRGTRRARSAAFDLAIQSGYSEPARRLSAKGKAFAPNVDAYYDALVAADLHNADVAPFATSLPNKLCPGPAADLNYLAAVLRRLRRQSRPDDEVLWSSINDISIVAACAGVRANDVREARSRWCEQLCACASHFSSSEALLPLVPDLAAITKQYRSESAATTTAWAQVLELCMRCCRVACDQKDVRSKMGSVAVAVEACVGLAPFPKTFFKDGDAIAQLPVDTYLRIIAAVGRRDKNGAKFVVSHIFSRPGDVEAVFVASAALAALLVGESFISLWKEDDNDPWTIAQEELALPAEETPRIDDDRLFNLVVTTLVEAGSNSNACPFELAFAIAAIAATLAPVASRRGAKRLAESVAKMLEKVEFSAVSLQKARLGCLAVKLAARRLEAKGLVRICRELGDSALDAASAIVPEEDYAVPKSKRRRTNSFSDDDDDRRMRDDFSSSDEEQRPSAKRKNRFSSSSEDESDSEDHDLPRAALTVEARERRLWLARLGVEAGASNLSRLIDIFCRDPRDRADAAAIAEKLSVCGVDEISLRLLEGSPSIDKRKRNRAKVMSGELLDQDGVRLFSAAARGVNVAATVLASSDKLKERCLVIIEKEYADDLPARAAGTLRIVECAKCDIELVKKAVARVRTDLCHEHASCRMAAANGLATLAASTKWKVDELAICKKNEGWLNEMVLLTSLGAIAATSHKALFELFVRSGKSPRAAACVARAADRAGFSSAAAFLDANLLVLVARWCKNEDGEYSSGKLLTFPSTACGLSQGKSFARRMRDVVAPLMAASIFADDEQSMVACQLSSPQKKTRTVATMVARRAPAILAACYVAKELDEDAADHEIARRALAYVESCRGFKSLKLTPIVRAVLDDSLPFSKHSVDKVAWSIAARRALDHIGDDNCLGDASTVLMKCGAPILVLWLGERLKAVETPRLDLTLQAMELTMMLTLRISGVPCAGIAALVAIVERADGGRLSTKRRRMSSIALLSKVVELCDDLSPPLVATVYIVATSIAVAYGDEDDKQATAASVVGEPDAELRSAADALREYIDNSHHRKRLLDDATAVREYLLGPPSATVPRNARGQTGGMAKAVPELDFGNGPLERPRRVQALIEIRSRRLRKNALMQCRLEDTRLAYLASSVTIDSRERALAGDCLGKLAYAGVVAEQATGEERAPNSVGKELCDDFESRKLVLVRELARCLVSVSPIVARAAIITTLAVAANEMSRASLTLTVDNFVDDPHCAMLSEFYVATTSCDSLGGEWGDGLEIGSSASCRLASELITEYFRNDEPVGDDPFLCQCVAICGASNAFARLALPLLIYNIVASRRGKDQDCRIEARLDVGKRLRKFLVDDPEVFVNIIEFVRARQLELFLYGTVGYTYRLSPAGRPYLPFSPPLELNATLIAQAALRAKTPASAIMYAVFASDDIVDGEPETGSCRSMLVEAYSSLGDADALRVLSSEDNDFHARLALYKAEGAWSSVLGISDAALATFGGSCQLQPAVANALRHLGLSHVADAYSRSLAHGDDTLASLAEFRHETSWRYTWRCDEYDKTDDLGEGGFHGAVRDALTRISERDFAGASQALDRARDAALIGKEARLPLLAALAETREAVEGVRLNLVQDCDDRLAALCSKVCSESDDEDDEIVLAIREGWLRSARKAIGRDVDDGPSPSNEESLQEQLSASLRRVLSATAESSTLQGKVDAAEAAAARLGRELESGNDDKWRQWLQIAEAKNLWARGRVEEAMRQVARLANEKTEYGLEALRLAGAWSVKARSLPSSMVLDMYLRPAASSSSSKMLDEARFALGEYVSRLHGDAVKRLSSSEWRQSERVANERRAEMESCENRMKRLSKESREYRSLNAQHRILKSECDADTATREAQRGARRAHLVEALRSFRAVVESSENFDLASRSAASLVSLWLLRGSDQSDDETLAEIRAVAGTSRPAPFAPLLYQLSSRIGGGDEALDRLVFRLCKSVPEHAVLQLVALANGDKVRGHHGAKQFLENNQAVGSPRLSKAKALLSQLKTTRLNTLVRGLEELGAAYVDLAMINANELVDGAGGTSVSFKDVIATATSGSSKQALGFFTQRIRKQQRGRADSVSESSLTSPRITTRLPTAREAARRQGEWTSPTIWRYSSTFNLTETGVHRPKIVSVEGDDGKAYRELIKGLDDTRQDAVMQQVFDAVNEIVSRASKKRAKTSVLRTYNIIPLSPLTGALEFVENTVSFGDYLVGKSRQVAAHARASKSQQIKAGLLGVGAHTRYYPEDLRHQECREHLATAHAAVKEAAAAKKRLGTNLMLDAYLDVCRRFHPAFRYYFVELFGDDAQTWLDRTKTYTTSVAAASMIGYILGIGDRHAQNILVTTDTAEVVHIDFGIAFEQGKALRIPETVPFRLTRDVVDGMGVQKTDGHFQTCATQVLKALRAHTQPLMTILDVLVHDPLYNWMLTPRDARHKQQQQQQGSSSKKEDRAFPMPFDDEDVILVDETRKSISPSSSKDQTPAAAERVLLRVRNKLQGYTDDGGQVLSPEGQVKQLIADAQDPENLCAIFHGWAAWL